MLVGKIPASPADTSNPWSYVGSRWNASSTVNESECQNLNGGDALNRGYYGYQLQEDSSLQWVMQRTGYLKYHEAV